MQGFKSFVEKTTLEFPACITAIVGPNGSGKSNVVDAVRWVLGEQSLKNLRSAKSEDVIFSGTPKKTAASFASVALHFDNSKKIFPVEYSDLAIGRKLYRDGTSEYLLNRNPARLKDIVQLLAAARLGVGGLAIINQGAGDVFLRASTDERREMLEEVIGLKEFRMKKEEAERKLEETASNIEKVGALLAEIEPHLRSLKRQASRWEKRQEKETLLKALEEKYFRIKLGEIERFGEEFIAEKKRLESELKSLVSDIKTLEEEFASRQDLLVSGTVALRQIDNELVVLEARRAGILRDLGKIEGRLEAEVERRIQAKPFPREVLLEKLTHIRNRLREVVLVSEFEALKLEIEKVLDDLDKFLSDPTRHTEKPAFVEEKARFERSLSDLEGKIRDLAAKKESLGQGDENAAAKARELLKDLDARRLLAREKEAVLQEYRFEEEKRALHENELRVRMKEAGWNFNDFKKSWASIAPPAPDGTMEDLEMKVLRLRRDLADIGAVDEEIIKEFKETEGRWQFLTNQKTDLEKAKEDLDALAQDLEKKIASDFGKALKDIGEQFQHYFRIIFGGGNARLKEVKYDTEQKLPGIEVSVDLPRKKIKSIDMLSGGERALTSIALIFAVVGTSSPPFLVLDEIDASLDEANSVRFANLLKELAKKTQFILITHNRATMEVADILYGVTIGDGVSKLFSLKFEEAQKVASQDVHPT